MQNRSDLRGISFIILATFTFVCNDICIKAVLPDYPTMQTLALRAAAASFWCFLLILIFGYGAQLRSIFNPWVMARGLFEALAVLCFTTAILHMNLADVVTILQIAPFLILIASSLIWHERIGGWRMILILIALAGAFLIAQPGSAAASPYAVFAFIAAFASAGRDLVGRKVPSHIPGLIVTFMTMMIGFFITLSMNLVFEPWLPVTFSAVGFTAAAGLLLMCGHTFLFLSYRAAPPNVIAPFYYCAVLWAILLAYIFYDEVPNVLAIFGIVLIVLSGLCSLWVDWQEQRKKATHTS